MVDVELEEEDEKEENQADPVDVFVAELDDWVVEGVKHVVCDVCSKRAWLDPLPGTEWKPYLGDTGDLVHGGQAEGSVTISVERRGD